jgi:hypothetical protein
MTEDMRQIRREISKTRHHLNSLEHKLKRMQHKGSGKTKYNIARLEKKFHKKYPYIKVDRELLALVGTLPGIPARKDKEVVRHIVAERYA